MHGKGQGLVRWDIQNLGSPTLRFTFHRRLHHGHKSRRVFCLALQEGPVDGLGGILQDEKRVSKSVALEPLQRFFLRKKAGQVATISTQWYDSTSTWRVA